MTALPRLATAMNSADDPGVLRTVAMPGVALAAWTRRPPAGFQAWLDGLAPERLPRLRRTLPAADVADAVSAACMRAGTPAGAHRDHLLADLALIVRLASEALAVPLVELRLDVSEGQACPRWHIDSVRGRLLCTLRGPGTEFGPARPDGAPSVIHRLPTGAVGLFRGLLWPGREISGIVHRSPPADAGTTRLLVVVDPVDAAHPC